MISNKEIGKMIQTLREEQQITQLELANLIGKSLSSTQKYEQGYTTLPVDVLANIADALGYELKIKFEQKK